LAYFNCFSEGGSTGSFFPKNPKTTAHDLRKSEALLPKRNTTPRQIDSSFDATRTATVNRIFMGIPP
jgi:hypothetical protein